MKTYKVNGFYGSGNTPCTVFVVENSNGSRWYAIGGSQNVNLTFENIEDGVNVETLSDVDYFTGITVYSLEDLIEAIDA